MKTFRLGPLLVVLEDLTWYNAVSTGHYSSPNAKQTLKLDLIPRQSAKRVFWLALNCNPNNRELDMLTISVACVHVNLSESSIKFGGTPLYGDM